MINFLSDYFNAHAPHDRKIDRRHRIMSKRNGAETTNVRVYFDIEIDEQLVGRLKMEASVSGY